LPISLHTKKGGCRGSLAETRTGGTGRRLVVFIQCIHVLEVGTAILKCRGDPRQESVEHLAINQTDRHDHQTV